MRVSRALLCLIAIAVSGASPQSGRSAEPVRVAVLVSHEEIPFAGLESGFLQFLKSKKVDASLEVYRFAGDATRARAAVESLKKSRPALVLAAGSLAADLAVRELTDLPIVTSFLLKTDFTRKGAPVAGVSLEFSAEIQFDWMRRILPGVKSVGVLYGAGENRAKVDDARALASRYGLRLIAREVRAPRELPAALESLVNRVDALWGIPDSVVLTPETAQNILLFSFRNQIPFIGLSAAWVRAGALYSLDCDYFDMGLQSGELALRLLREPGARSGAFVPPRKAVYSLNLKAARHMKLQMPQDLVAGAQHVF